MVMHTSMSNTYIIISRELKKPILDPPRAYVFIGHGRYRKRASKRKWMDCEYHVQDRRYVQHKSVKLSCSSTQFQALLFCGPHAKTHWSRGWIKHYHLRLDPKLGHGKCEIGGPPVRLELAKTCYTNHGSQVSTLPGNHATNLLKNAHAGLF